MEQQRWNLELLQLNSEQLKAIESIIGNARGSTLDSVMQQAAQIALQTEKLCERKLTLAEKRLKEVESAVKRILKMGCLGKKSSHIIEGRKHIGARKQILQSLNLNISGKAKTIKEFNVHKSPSNFDSLYLRMNYLK